VIAPNCRSTYNYFTVFIDSEQARRSRDEAYEHLAARGIQAKKYFYPALHLQEVYRPLREIYRGRLPVTERAAAQGLALPLFSHMEPDSVDQVSDALREILG
jgi:dTDP-4-amino-4,6-dideoxygalactose transaminase